MSAVENYTDPSLPLPRVPCLSFLSSIPFHQTNDDFMFGCIACPRQQGKRISKIMVSRKRVLDKIAKEMAQEKTVSATLWKEWSHERFMWKCDSYNLTNVSTDNHLIQAATNVIALIFYRNIISKTAYYQPGNWIAACSSCTLKS